MKTIISVSLLAVAVTAIGIGLTDNGDLNGREPRTLTPPPAPSRASGSTPRSDAEEDLRQRRSYDLLRLADPRTGQLPPDIHRREQEFAARIPRRAAHARGEKEFTWTFRGPDNVGGRTRALAIDVADPTSATLLAGGISGGLWRSGDGGATWSLTTGSSQIHNVSSLAQDTRTGHRNVWYYGTGEGEGGSAAWPQDFEAHAGDGVFKSTDGGVSWSQLPATAGADPQGFDSPWQFVWRLVTDPSETINDEVYAATWGFIFRSIDGGLSWTPVLGDPNTLATYTDVAVTPGGVVYATLSYDGGQHGTFRSTDGVNWTDITPPGYAGYDRIVPAIAPANASIVWFLVANTWGLPDAALFRYQYLSGNGSGAGGSWSDRSAPLAALPGAYGTTHYETQGNYCQMLAIHPANPETVYLGGVSLYRSTDGFQTAGNITLIGGWGYPNHHADLHWLTFRPGSTSYAYTGSDGGVHGTADINAGVVVWNDLNRGYNTSQFYTVAVDEELYGNETAIGGTQDNGSLFGSPYLPGADWAFALEGDGGYCAVADASGLYGTYYMSYQQNYGVYRVTLNNATGGILDWAMVDPIGAETSLWLKPYILDPNDRTIMYLAADDLLWRNSDLTAIPSGNGSPVATNWAVLTQDPGGDPISALAVSRSPGQVLYFGTAGGSVCRLYDPATVIPPNTAIRLDVGAGFPAGAYVSSITVHPQDDQRVVVAFSNYNVINLFATANGGATWSPVEGNLGGPDSPSVRSVAYVATASADYVLAATSTGLYSTAELAGAATIWLQEGGDVVGNVVVDMLAVRQADRYVVAGTHGKGVVQGYIGVSAVGESDTPRPARLAQNVPNPFNPTTSIRFALDAPGQVRVRVFDAAGRRVAELLAAHRDAGEHTVVWDGTDDAGRRVASGTYICRLEAAGSVETVAMALVK